MTSERNFVLIDSHSLFPSSASRRKKFSVCPHRFAFVGSRISRIASYMYLCVCLASLTEHNIFEVNQCRNFFHYSVLFFFPQIVFHYIAIPYFVYPVEGSLDFFHSATVVNSEATNI